MPGPISVSRRQGRTYHKFGGGFYSRMWKKARAKNYSSVSEAGNSYWDHVTATASAAAFHRNQEDLSAETLPENSSLIDFSSFAKEYPEKLFPLLERLRPEFQEYFIEHYILHKPQWFIGKTHGCIQTRVWQALRIIERTIGAFIILGTHPKEEVLRPIIERAGLEKTQYGSLTSMIMRYAATQDYTTVAKTVKAPVPDIRKIFRPAITALLADKDIKTVAVGAYLRNLTHQASLTSAGLSKRSIARTRRVKNLKFTAPPIDVSPLISFNAADSLKNTPWNMLEISSELRMAQIAPVLRAHGKRLFGKKAAQIFAPLNAEGELAFGYIFARCAVANTVRGLTRVRGISEMAASYTGEGELDHAVTVPHSDVKDMMAKHSAPSQVRIHLNDFVEILTGEAARYCGTVTRTSGDKLAVEVSFPSGRRFRVLADATCVKMLPKVPASKRAFWGVKN